MLGQMRAGDASQPPEERFASQLDQLASMGFVDRQANIQGAPTSKQTKIMYVVVPYVGTSLLRIHMDSHSSCFPFVSSRF